MAKQAVAMERNEIKAALRHAVDAPIGCALGLGEDPGLALLLLDKIKPGRRLLTELQKTFPALKMPAWGTVQLDPDKPKALNVLLNKVPSGTARRMLKALRGTGIKFLNLQGEDGSAESAVGEDEEEPDAAAAPAAPSAPAAADVQAAAGAVTYAKSRLAWLTVRQRMAADIARLRAEIAAEYAGIPEAPQIMAGFERTVEPMLQTLDERLADALDDAGNATDPAVRATLVAEARALIASYQAYVAGEPLIAELDANPFVPLSTNKTLTATLGVLAASVR